MEKIKTNSDNVFYNILPYGILIAIVGGMLVALGKFLGLNGATKYVIVIALNKIVEVLKIVIPFAIGIMVSVFFNPDIYHIACYEIYREVKDSNSNVIDKKKLERRPTDFGLYIKNNEKIFRYISRSILVFVSILISKYIADIVECPAAIRVINGMISLTQFMLYRTMIFVVVFLIVCITTYGLSSTTERLYNDKVDRLAGERYERSKR